MIVLAVVALAADYLLTWLEKRLLKWRPRRSERRRRTPDMTHPTAPALPARFGISEKERNRMAHSLRGRLLWWLLLPLAVFVLIAGAMSYDTARTTAALVQDSALVASARTIGEDVEWRNGLPVADVPPAALEIFESPSRDSVFYKVIDGHDRLLAGTPALDVPARHGVEPTLYDTSLDGVPLRAVAYDRQLYDEGQIETVTVVVAKTTRSHGAMVATIWRPQLVRLSLMLVLAMGLVYLGLTFEMRPLMKLKDDVADRGPMELEPIRPERLQHELRPIVDAINQCIARLNTHTATQRRFIADAAHQLRTPIAVLDTQIQYAQQRGNDDRGSRRCSTACSAAAARWPT